jgi:hypothetical protein
MAPGGFRKGNDKIAERARKLDADAVWEFVCECGSCAEEVRATLERYDAARAAGAPLLAPGHEQGTARS